MASRKGQAAMEYLMTYGWALVLLVAVIAALMATGAFNPSYLVSEECTLQPDLSCGNDLLYKQDASTTVLLVQIDNGLGYDIILKDAKVTTMGLGVSGQQAWPAKALTPVEVKQGSNHTIEFDFTGPVQPTQGEIERMTMGLTYVSCAPEVNPDCSPSGSEHTISGRIVARVETQTT